MGSKKTFELLGSSERIILEILWRDGPCSIAQLMEQHPAAYMTVRTTMGVLLRKGFVTRQRDTWPHTFTAAPKAVLLHAAFERMLTELGATAADRAHILEALRG
jgi:predicted transcriptional regulator